MINNVNGTAPNSFFVPPAAAPTAPISISAVPPPFPSYVQVVPANKEVTEEPDPTEKELASLLNGEGGLSVVDRVAAFKV
jgi:hypothetical protein